MLPLDPKLIPEQEMFLMLHGNGGFNYVSIEEMLVSERYFFVNELKNHYEELEKMRREEEIKQKFNTK